VSAAPALRPRASAARGLVVTAQDAEEATAADIWADAAASRKPFINYVSPLVGSANYSAQSLMTATNSTALTR